MIRLISVKCPDCGAALQFEEGRQTAFCSYCGAKILLHNENEHIYRSIDEAGIKQAENDRLYMMKELEMEEREEKHHRTLTSIWVFLTIAAIVTGFFLVSTDPVKDSDGIGGSMIGFGAISAEFLLIWLMSDKKKKSRNRNRPGYAMVPKLAEDFSEIHYTAVVEALRAAGFSSIKTINLSDLRLGIFNKNGSVDAITIGGENVTSEGWYRQEAPVIITYHGFPDQRF